MIVERMTDLIGDTPLLKIPPEITGLKNIDLYGKLEMLNPYGSVKDRIAWEMIKDDLDDMAENKQTIFENSSGNTAKALCAIASAHGVPFKLVSALAKVRETKEMLQLLGAEIEEVAAASDCFDPSDPNDPQFLIEKAARESGGKVYFTSQFTNEKNPDIHEHTTGQEVIDDLGCVDFLFGGLGTSGSTLGMARAFRKNNPDFACIGLTAAKGQYLPGIRSIDQMWESGLYERENYQDVVVVKERAALEGMLTLNRKLGLLCGPSAGGNYSGALDYLREIDHQLTERKTAVFIVCDRVEWYMSYIRERMPELFGEEAKPDSFMSFDMDDAPEVPDLTINNIELWIEQKSPVIIDIRAAVSFDMHKMDGSFNIPQDTFEKLLNETDPFPKDRPILLICAIGEKAKKHAAYLRQRGYDAYFLRHGIHALVDRPELLAA